jgi:hypothetical protein
MTEKKQSRCFGPGFPLGNRTRSYPGLSQARRVGATHCREKSSLTPDRSDLRSTNMRGMNVAPRAMERSASQFPCPSRNRPRFAGKRARRHGNQRPPWLPKSAARIGFVLQKIDLRSRPCPFPPEAIRVSSCTPSFVRGGERRSAVERLTAGRLDVEPRTAAAEASRRFPQGF